MAFLTLLSDYGDGSHYVAAIKGTLYSLMPSLSIVDISHGVKPHDVVHAAFILKNSARTFPPGTLHMICVDTGFEAGRQYLVAESGGHRFIGADNGIFPLLFEHQPVTIHALNPALVSAEDMFPDKNLFAPIAVRLLTGEPLDSLASLSAARNVKHQLAPVVEDHLIRGAIVFVDGFGNAITNISKELFDEKAAVHSRFAIFYRKKEKISRISLNYRDAKGGGELALFNESGHLEIAMNAGPARQFLGLQVEGKIIVEFYD